MPTVSINGRETGSFSVSTPMGICPNCGYKWIFRSFLKSGVSLQDSLQIRQSVYVPTVSINGRETGSFSVSTPMGICPNCGYKWEPGK